MKPLYSSLILLSSFLLSLNSIAQQKKPNTSDSIYTAQALAKYNQGLYDDAIKLCNIAIQSNPRYYWVYNVRGVSYAAIAAEEKRKNNGTMNEKAKQNYEYAINDYSKSIELLPSYQNAFGNRALSYYEMRLFDKAISDWSEVIRMDPKNIQ